MSLNIAPMDSYRVFQRDTITGNPSGSTTTYNKGWGEVDLNITSNTPGPVSYRIVDGQDPTRVIQDWTASGKSVTAGQSTIALQIAASEDCYIVQVAPSSDTSSYASTTPFFMGNIDAAAGQSKATGFFGSYEYGSDDAAAQPSQYLTPSFSTRVLTSDSMPRYTDALTAWLQPGDNTTPGGAVVSTFPAEYLNLRQAELGVACALIGNSRPGASVNDFAPGNLYGGLLDALVTRVGGKISAFIWNQGDADTNPTGVANYQATFQSVITQLDAVTTTPYRVIAFDYMWIHGANPDRFVTAIDLAKQAVASAHGGSFREGISAGDDYFGWHPSMLARMLAADDVYRQVLALDNPNEDKGPSLTGIATRIDNIVDLQVKQDKGTELLGQVTEFGPTSVSFRNATPDELQSQFSAFERGYTDAAHRIAVVDATVVSATDIRLTLASTPTGAVDIWYRADYDGGDADVNAGNAGIRDNFTADGVSYGVGLQTRLTPISVAADGSAIADSGSTGSSSWSSAPSTPVSPVTTGSTGAGSTSTGSTGGSSSTTDPSSSGGTTSTSSTGLVLNISEDAWQGDAQYTISVDGQQVGGVRTATALHGAGQTEAISLPTNLAAGHHTVTVDFLNDSYNGTPDTDRNLYVDGMKLAGSAVPNGSAVLKSQGPVSLDLVVPAGSTGAGSTSTGSTGGSSSTTDPSSSGGTTSTSSTGLVLNISEDAWQGDAQYTISVDGQQVGGVRTATALHGAGQTEAISLPTNLAAGHHTVTVDFLNDSYNGTPDTDRNLYVDGMKLAGSAVPNGSAVLKSQGPVSLDLVVPAGSTGAGSTSTGSTGGSSSTTDPSSSGGTTSTSSTGLVLNISEDAWQGDAQYTISVDGQQVGGVRTATALHGAGQTEAISLPTNLAAGHHTVTVDFLNDSYNGTPDTDRNLYVDGMKLAGSAVPNGSAVLKSQGPVSLDLVVPAGSTGAGSTSTGSTGGSSSTTDPSSSGGTTSTSSTGLVLNISEDAWQGDAQYTISVDGQQVGGVRTATALHGAGQTEAISLPTNLAAGHHTVTVDFLNDSYNGTPDTDRNLYVDGMKLAGSAVPNGSAVLKSQGPVSLDLVVPAGSTGAGSTSTGSTGGSSSTTDPSSSGGTTSTSSTGLVLNISEDAWQGDAQYTISVDGQQVGGVRTATALHGAGQTEAISLPTNLAAGHHTVTVDFLNDSYNGTPDTDRNLYVDGMKLAGSAVPNGSAVLKSQGPVSLDLVVPAGSTGAGSTSTGSTGGSSSTTDPSSSGGTTSTSSTGLVLNISEDAWQGDAQYTISVDGQQVGGVHTATALHGAGQTEAISLPTNLAAGHHTVTVDFLNDSYNGTPDTDRNLYVDGMKLAGSAVPNGSAVLKSQGPVSLDLVVPAGSTGAGSTSTGSTGGSSSTTDPSSSGGTTGTAPSVQIPDVSKAGLLTVPAIVNTSGHNVLTVGIGKEFTTINAALAASSDNDIILVDAGTYTNDFATTSHKLTIAGVGGMVNMVATEFCPNGKAILTVDDDLTLENFTFTGASVSDGNGAGIRYESGNLVLINDAFYSNQNGLLGAASGGTITIQNSLFSGNGSGTGYTHNLYVGQISQLDVTQSVFENAVVGHELKSRAIVNNLSGNIFNDGPNGTASYDIDLPNGGIATITGNLIEKGPLAENNSMIHFGGEGLPYADSALTIDGNVFVNDKGSSTIGVLNATTISAIISNNTFVNLPSEQIVSGAASVVNNKDGGGKDLGNVTVDAFPDTSSVVFNDNAEHSVVLDANPLLNVRGGAGHLKVLAIHGHVLAVGGSGGLDFSEQTGSGANQIQTAAGSTNTLTLTGGDFVVSRGTDTIRSGAYDVTGTVSGNAQVESGSAYDKWSVTGNLRININGGDPNITLSNTATAVVTGNASGLDIINSGGTALVDVTQVGGEHDGEAISFSITSGSVSAGLWQGKVDISTATGTRGSLIHLGKGTEQVTSNGSDEIWAGSGNDTVILSNGNAVVHAGTGDLGVFGRGIPSGVEAKVFGNGGKISIGGDTGNIVYYGGDLANAVDASLSNITLIGGAGRMSIVGAAYNQVIAGGSGGVTYSTASSASGSIGTAIGSTNALDLGSSPFTIDSWGNDVITGGAGGILTVHGDATISGGMGNRTVTLMGNDVFTGAGVDTVTVTEGANVVYTSGQSGTVTERGATLSVYLGGSMSAAADVIGGAATVRTDIDAGMSITTGSTGTALHLHSGQIKVVAGGADKIDADSADAIISINSNNVSVNGGSGAITVLSQTSEQTGLHFAAGSGTAAIHLSDGGGNDVVFGLGNTSTYLSGGKADIFELFAGNGGGLNVINGFRSGVDQILLHDVRVVSQTSAAGSLTLMMSDNSKIQLNGVTTNQGIWG